MRNLLGDESLKVEVFPSNSNGVASRSVHVLTNVIRDLDNAFLDKFLPQLTYDTFQNLGNKMDDNCYTFRWNKKIKINQIIMTMGFPYTDGGWWRSLRIEYKGNTGTPWLPIHKSQFSPSYNFMNTSFGRFPFENYRINFPEIEVMAIRLIGKGGGFSSFTSISSVEAYLINSIEDEKIRGRNYPLPKLYKLISPDKIWYLGDCLYKATGLSLVTTHLQYYLTAESFKQYQLLYEPKYRTPDVWRLLNDKDHWENYTDIFNFDKITTNRYFRNLFALINGPILLDGNCLGSIFTNPPVVLKEGHIDSHKKLAKDFEIDWDTYKDAMSKTVCMNEEMLDGIARLIEFIIHEILHQIHYARMLNKKEEESKPLKESLIQDALDIMDRDLENGIYIDLILEKLNVSYHKLSTAFKKSHGTTPNKILHELKLERAKKYLLDQRFRIIDIAGTLGYTENHLIRSFKTKYGMTPGNYRRQNLDT